MIKKINESEIREAVLKSGYLLEQRVLKNFLENKYFAEANHFAKIDPESEKFRELDVYATKNEISAIINDSDVSVYSHFLVECKNNLQPIVLFENISDRDEPNVNFNYELLNGSIELREMISINLIHLLNEIEFEFYGNNASRQYCTFELKNRRQKEEHWQVSHGDEIGLYSTFQKLVNFVQFKRKMVDQKWNGRQPDFMRMELFFPIIVLQNDLFLVDIDEKFVLKKVDKHRLKFSSQMTIDIVTEKSLNNVLEEKKTLINAILEDLKTTEKY